ncbi:SAM-dependent methyltransferase [Pleionea sp. CnH1-48]|uniref:SAM-dependent methyltransferase n=1 Tax=Pleionea sp. CnH1-48 TaxID=2954494 RepID=UPI002097312C|nr:SAM-dependent methyltransferase [Pleionea sp. CnH1-48]MCO7222926.1 SAM-dependent methyltransferase [Pleionea sp. CnH1-48]
MSKGQLTIVGTGIFAPAHISQEAIRHIQSSDVVFATIPDPLSMHYVQKLNTNVVSMGDLYEAGEDRVDTYEMMVTRILNAVREGQRVCAIYYGHPGIFVYAAHKAIKLAREEGFEANLLPAISAEDCLFADLGIDPASHGCQAYEASQFLFYQHSINSYSSLILWQLGVVGDTSLKLFRPADNGMAMLQDKLLTLYPADHKVTVYEAATLPIIPPRIEEVALSELSETKVREISTLFVPAVSFPPIDHEFCERWQVQP